MKPYLLASALCCCASIIRTSPRSYRFTAAYLLALLPCTLAFRSESTWLYSWYPILAGPVVLLRLVAGIEIAHRQTEEFRWWARLMGTVFLLAGAFAALAWVQSGRHDVLGSVVELRRLIQIYLGAVFLVLECFWLSQGGGLWRRADQIALGFALLTWNHAGVSFIAGVWRFDSAAWETVQRWSWGIDGVCYLMLTALFLDGPQFGLRWLSDRRSRLAGTRFPAGDL